MSPAEPGRTRPNPAEPGRTRPNPAEPGGARASPEHDDLDTVRTTATGVFTMAGPGIRAETGRHRKPSANDLTINESATLSASEMLLGQFKAVGTNARQSAVNRFLARWCGPSRRNALAACVLIPSLVGACDQQQDAHGFVGPGLPDEVTRTDVGQQQPAVTSTIDMSVVDEAADLGSAAKIRPARVAPEPQPWDDEYLLYDAGCIDLESVQAVNDAVSNGIGPLIAFDALRSIELDGGQLWMVQDAFLDFPDDGPAETLRDAQYANNLAILFDEAGCGTILTRPSNPNDRLSFEYGSGEVNRARYFWPLGGEVHGDEVQIYWALMVESDEEPSAYDGIIRHTESTHLARYDKVTLERLSFEPAQHPGVDPQWGFEMLTADDWTYLFGNDNLLNLARVGGLGAGPHPSVDMFVGRVPAGSFDMPMEVWDGTGWNTELATAAAISTRGYIANQMHPRRFGDIYVSVTAIDEFWDDELIIDVARSPEGPWIEVDRINLDRDGLYDVVSYHPALLSAHEDDTLTVVVSYNAAIWDEAVQHPELYQPLAVDLDLRAIRATLRNHERRAEQAGSARSPGWHRRVR